jgi:hypothetical protein
MLERAYGVLRDLPVGVVAPVMLLFMAGYSGKLIMDSRGE